MRTVFLTVAAALLFATPAQAQIAIGQGAKPSVAMDAAGTASIVWHGTQLESALHFCRLPRGASACSGAATIVAGSAATGTSLSRPFVSVSGSTVRVVQYRYGFSSGQFARVMLYTSADGGDSWDAGVSIGSASPSAFDEAVFGPGATISAVSDNSGFFQNLPLAPGVGAPPSDLFPGYPYSGGVALTPAGSLVAVSANGAGDTVFRAFNGGNINDPSSWGDRIAIGYTEYPRLASAFNGPFLLAGDVNGVMFVRRWSGVGFDTPVSIGSGDSSESHLFSDPGGRLHAVFPRLDAQGYHLQHSVSDDGVNWSSGSVLVQTHAEQAYLRVAAAADHIGVAVWAADREIRVVPIGPGAPATPPPPPTPTPVPPVPTPVPTPAFGKTVVVRPVSGVVRVRLPRSNRFIDLTSLDDVPLGATLDTKRGIVELSSKPRTGAVQTIRLDGGWFRVSQNRTTTDFSLNEPLASCGRAASTAQRKPKSRKLWGDGKGRFRTKGRYSAATVRGTRWLVQDTCAGTLTRVTQGSVVVRHGRRSVVVRAGRHYLARRPR